MRLKLAIVASICVACVLSACLTSAVTSSLFVTLEAQSLPVMRNLQWDPNAASDAVTFYTVVQDGGAPVTIDPATCTATVCSTPITFTAAGTHTLSVTATNEWATSLPTTITVNVVVPGKPGGLKIR